MTEDEEGGEALLDTVGLAHFLEEDNRPTVVLDVAVPSTSPHIAWNPAFALFRQSLSRTDPQLPDKYLKSLVEWASTATASKTYHRGRTWTTFTILGRWRVIAAREGETTGQVGIASARALSISELRSAKRAKTSADEELPAEQRTPPTLPREGSDQSSTSNSDGGSFIDWTQRELPGLSPYVQAFRTHDWNNTPVGPMIFWPLELRVLVVEIMSNPEPRIIFWGKDNTLIYNQASSVIFGSRHPGTLGRSPADVFPDIWENLAPLVNAALYEGKTTQVHYMPLAVERSPTFTEETCFSFILQPILGPSGTPVGVLDQFTEITAVVLAERRMRTVLNVGEQAANKDNLPGVWKGVITALDANTDDIPFAMLYSVINEEAHSDNSSRRTSLSAEAITPHTFRCTLEGTVGVDRNHESVHENINLADEDNLFARQFRSALLQRKVVQLYAADGTLPMSLVTPIPGRVGDVSTTQAVICPILAASSSNCLGFLVLGISGRRPYDEDYQRFIRLLNDRLNHSTAIVSLPIEQRLVQAATEEAALTHAALSRQLLQRTQEAELREAKFTRMAQGAPVGCFIVREDGTPIYLNDAYYDITKTQRPEQVKFGEGSMWRSQIIPEDVHKVEKAWSEITKEMKPTTVEYRHQQEWVAFDNATGVNMRGPTWLRMTALPEVDDDGDVKTVIGWVLDISLEKWTEALQEKRLADALESKIQSERFIDLVSHEMRNPLSAILQSADGILASLPVLNTSGMESNEISIAGVAEGAKTIILCAQHQKRIVDDILTLSKLDSDLLVLCPEVGKPIEVAKKALKMYESELRAADVAAEIVVDPSYSKLQVNDVLLDSSRLLQVLINLLTNALKWTRGSDQRRITVTLSATESWPPNDFDVKYMPRRRPDIPLSLEWGDSPEIYLVFSTQDTGVGLTQKEIDTLFLRFSQPNPRSHGGSGLGLFISKELCELQGGQIGVSSEAGEGSTFTFYIKVRRYDPSIQQGESNVMESRRASLTVSSNTPPTVGFGIENMPEPFVPAPTIGQPQPTLATPPVPLPVHETVRKAEDLHVLVVEDNVINQKVMSAGLKRLGCASVHVRNNGVEALEFLEESSFKSRTPDSASSSGPPTPLSLVLLDVEMPVMDGLTCIRRIREMEDRGEFRSHVPVAAVTANARTEQLNDALSHGMDLVITKPFRMPELLPKMLALVEGMHITNENPVYSYIEGRK